MWLPHVRDVSEEWTAQQPNVSVFPDFMTSQLRYFRLYLRPSTNIFFSVVKKIESVG